MNSFRFVVVADSHIRLPNDEVDAYPSNALMVLRNQFVVDLCNRVDAAFVVHLGDIVHPLPAEAGHEAAVQLAASVYEGLSHRVHFVAGNHDIGDKPDALVAVPPVTDESYEVFERYWGAPYGSFDVEGCHFVTVDTPVLNSGLDREEAQRVWLEDDLAAASAAGQRIFLFTHYPPFIRERSEDEHYDNLGEPARTWLLDLLATHEVEAVFSGHLHNFVYNHDAGTDLYVVPATGFVRPDYSELAAIAPEREGGRDDAAKLGFFVVDVTEGEHHIRPIRTFGRTDENDDLPTPLGVALRSDWCSPVGVTLRHGWASMVDFPTSGLDEFRRKTVRNDAPVLALWEARITSIKVPVGDLAPAEGALRLRQLAGRGMRFTVRSAGIPTAGTLETMTRLGADIVRWEVAAAPDTFEQVLAAVVAGVVPADVDLAIAPIVPVDPLDTSVHHFVASGFAPEGDELLSRWLGVDTDGVFAEIVFRVPGSGAPGSAVASAHYTAQAAGRRPVVNTELPRGAESRAFIDDQAVADHVAEAVAAAFDHPTVAVFLDMFMDHDRSYYPRHGLIDRRHNPRPALHRLITEAAAGT